MPIRFGSVCSGIEAASVAWGPLGWEAAWLSEIEPFPCALLAHYYPNVPNLGDMTTIKDRILRGEVEAPDVFCGGTPCFTAGHLVLTETGYKPIESIQVGEKVITHKGRLRPVLRVGHKQAKVGVLKMIGHKPIICTPNHKFYSVYWKRYITGAKNVVVKTTEPEWVEAEKLAGRQWTANINYEAIPMSIESAKFVNDDKRAMLMAGYYLGDGCLVKRTGKGLTGIKLAVNKEKLGKFKEHFGDIGTIFEVRTGYHIEINDKKYAEFLLREFGEYSHAKRIPAWVLSHPYRSELLKGYLETDGYKLDKGGYRITTVSPALAYGVTDLFNSLGYVASAGFVKMPKTCVIEGRACNQQNMYQVRAYPKEISIKSHHLHGYLCRKVQSYTLLDKEETVYNIEVDEDHSYCVGGMIAKNCQAFSLAGLRKSLSDNRAVLSLHFVEIANAIDHVRSLRGDKPVTIFWENVIGVLNTDDNAFGCFLGAIVGLDVPIPAPSENGFPTAGRVVGPKRHAAWRVLDAQYFGVPQRRRRVFVVASARDKGGVDPAEILFERPGMQGDFSESRAQGQGSASGATRSAPSDDSGPIQTLVAGYSKSYNTLQELDKLQISAFRESSFGGYEQDKVSSTLKAVGGALSGGSETFVSQKDNTPPPQELPKSRRNTDRE